MQEAVAEGQSHAVAQTPGAAAENDGVSGGVTQNSPA